MIQEQCPMNEEAESEEQGIMETNKRIFQEGESSKVEFCREDSMMIISVKLGSYVLY